MWRALASSGKPVAVLAPMLDVTDAAFRRVVASLWREQQRLHSKDECQPAKQKQRALVLITEFVSADGLCHSDDSQRRLISRMLKFDRSRKLDPLPTLAQLFGPNPEKVREAARICIHELGFDGIDLNFGCPDEAVVRQGAGAALINDPDRACELVLAAREGAGPGVPVSVKTRLGFERIATTKWLPSLLSRVPPDALTVHLRTFKEKSKCNAHWEEASVVAQLCRDAGVVSIGNGDVKSAKHGDDLARHAGLDGFMIGRAAIGNPWVLFDEGDLEITLSSRLAVAVRHARSFEDTFMLPQVSGHEQYGKPFHTVRKHLGKYSSGFRGCAELRAALVRSSSADEVEKHVAEYLVNYDAVGSSQESDKAEVLKFLVDNRSKQPTERMFAT